MVLSTPAFILVRIIALMSCKLWDRRGDSVGRRLWEETVAPGPLLRPDLRREGRWEVSRGEGRIHNVLLSDETDSALDLLR